MCQISKVMVLDHKKCIWTQKIDGLPRKPCWLNRQREDLDGRENYGNLQQSFHGDRWLASSLGGALRKPTQAAYVYWQNNPCWFKILTPWRSITLIARTVEKELGCIQPLVKRNSEPCLQDEVSNGGFRERSKTGNLIPVNSPNLWHQNINILSGK